MTETRPKHPVYAAPASRRQAGKKVATRPLPALEEVTPDSFARLSSHQRRELTLKLIEFLKSI